MLDIVLFIVASIITIPILVTILLYFLFKYLYQNPIKAFHQSINWTTILYIISVNVILTNIFGGFYVGYCIGFLLCILTILIIVQWKKNTEIDYHRAFKLLWRLSFLVFFVLYTGLVAYGIVRSILL